MEKYKIGILGATGMVGQRFLMLLENHPWFDVKILAASANSSGKTLKEALRGRLSVGANLPAKYKEFIVLDVEKDAGKIASEVDFVFCALGADKEKIKTLENLYAKLECPVISNNSANRVVADIPMVIPEINPEHLNVIPYQRERLGTKRGFVAVKSNCSIQCYVPVLHSLFDLGIKNILVCTYQAISGAGKNFRTWPEMVDNIIPYIAGEEEKSEREPLKIWGKVENGKIAINNSINITSQCLRVPVTDGHTAAVFASFEQPISLEEVKKRIQNFNGHEKSRGLPSSPKKFINLFEEPDRPQTKLDRNFENGMGISVGRLRKDTQYDVKFVCTSHNTVRGAAGGAVLLAEMLCREGYI